MFLLYFYNRAWICLLCPMFVNSNYLVFFFLMIRRPPRSTQPTSSAASDVYKRQVKHNELPRFTAQQKVWARSYGASNTRWLPAVIAETLGPKMYKVRLEDGSICRRHADQLRPRSQLPESLMPAEPPVSQGSAPSESGCTETDDCGDSELLNSAPTEPSSSGPEVCLPSELGDPFLAPPVPIPASPVSSGPESLDARPQRHCRPPDRFQLQERLRDFRRGRRK